MSIRSLLPSLWTSDNDKDVFYDLQSEVDRVFRQFRNFPSASLTDSATDGGLSKFTPRINVAETEKQYEVEVELPGIEHEDVDVNVLNQSLIIEGHKQSVSSKEEKSYRIVERYEGNFKRIIPLGFDVEDEDVKAKYKDGVLAIVVKKPLELTQKAKKIKVEKAEAT